MNFEIPAVESRILVSVFLILFLAAVPVLSRNFDDGDSFSHRIFWVDFKTCEDECNFRRSCRSISFLRRFSICELHSADVVNRRVRNQLPQLGIINTDVWKSDETVSRIRNRCDVCQETYDCDVRRDRVDMACEINKCEIPEDILGSRLLGNLRKIGSKRLYACEAPFEHVTDSIVCGRDGVWTDANISCTNCDLPDMKHGTVTMSRLNENTFRAHVLCDNNYIVRQALIPTCDTITGNWSNTMNWVCCDRKDEEPWTLIFRMNSGFPKPVSGGFRFGVGGINKTYYEHCQYRNDEIIGDWSSLTIQRIKVELIKDESVAAYLIFSGLETNDRSWFSVDNLLESSWSDLMSVKNTNAIPLRISFSGQLLTDDKYHRFVVATVLSNNPVNCDTDFGWMYVTKSPVYPCKTTSSQTGTRIIYSTAGVATKLQEGPWIDYADSLQISIDLEFPQ